MAEVENTNGVVPAQEAPKAKLRRGVSNQTRATSQLKFHERDANPNGLFVGQLKEVSIDWRTIGADSKGLASFAGLSIPRLVFHFTSNHPNEAEQRNVYHNLLPVESNIDTIPGGEAEWQVNQVRAWIKHMLDIFYLKGRELTPIEEDALTLPFVDFDEQGEYVAVDPEEVIAGYAAVFKTASDMLNGRYSDAEREATGKPYYRDANGGPIKVWMKLLRCKRVKDGWRNVTNGDLSFDPFIGEGVIELQKTNMPPAILKIDVSKESITPKEVNKQPTIGTPGTPIGGIVPSMMPNIPMGDNGTNSAYAKANSEMPF